MNVKNEVHDIVTKAKNLVDRRGGTGEAFEQMNVIPTDAAGLIRLLISQRLAAPLLHLVGRWVPVLPSSSPRTRALCVQ